MGKKGKEYEKPKMDNLGGKKGELDEKQLDKVSGGAPESNAVCDFGDNGDPKPCEHGYLAYIY